MKQQMWQVQVVLAPRVAPFRFPEGVSVRSRLYSTNPFLLTGRVAGVMIVKCVP